MRVLCLVPYPSLGASNRLRVEQYAGPLQRLGIDLTVSAFLDEDAYRILYLPGGFALKAIAVMRGMLRRGGDLIRAGRYDLILIHRESAPIGAPLVERWLRRRRIPYLFDFDDAIYIRAIHPANRRWSWLRQVNTTESVRSAAVVTVGNQNLADWAKPFNEHVVVIPTPVDADRYGPPDARAGGPFVIGWVGSSTTAPYLKQLDAAFARVGTDHSIVVRVVGGEYEAPGVTVESVPFTVAGEADALRGFDVGVLPEPDDEWARGKSGFKALLYMAAGLPVIASPVGANLEIVEDGVTGLLATDEASWVAALRRLIEDPALAQRMGRAGRDRLEQRYSLRVQAPRLAEALSAAAREGKK